MSIKTQNKKVFFLWSIFFFFHRNTLFFKKARKNMNLKCPDTTPLPPQIIFFRIFYTNFLSIFFVVRVFKPPPPSLISDSITNKKKCLIDFLPTSSPLKARVHGWTDGRAEQKSRGVPTLTQTDQQTDRHRILLLYQMYTF